MHSHADDLYARAKYEDMLREAKEHRRFAHVTGEPNVFERAFAALKSAFTTPTRIGAETRREYSQTPGG